MRMGLFIGASGWSYECWKWNFYAGVRRKDWLWFYARQFNAVEINTSFYGHLKPRTCERWFRETPDNFAFSIKANRFLTHIARLHITPQALARQRDSANALGCKLAVVIWQMPKSLSLDINLLSSFAAQLANWPEVRHALEFRHASWFCPEIADCLGRHGLAVCQSDAANWPLWDAVATDLVYVRLHGHEITYVSSYSQAQLDAWARKIESWLSENRQVHVYFDNTDAGHAPEDARRLSALLHTADNVPAMNHP